MWVCSLRYPIRNAHAPYCHLWTAGFYNICLHYLTNYTTFEYIYIYIYIYIYVCMYIIKHKMCVLIFPTTFVWNISHSKKNWVRMIKKMYIGVHKFSLFLSDFSETWIFSTYFRKIIKYQISWKSFQWKPSCCVRKEGETWRRQSLFAILRKAPKNNCRPKFDFIKYSTTYAQSVGNWTFPASWRLTRQLRMQDGHQSSYGDWI